MRKLYNTVDNLQTWSGTLTHNDRSSNNYHYGNVYNTYTLGEIYWRTREKIISDEMMWNGGILEVVKNWH